MRNINLDHCTMSRYHETNVLVGPFVLRAQGLLSCGLVLLLLLQGRRRGCGGGGAEDAQPEITLLEKK